VRLNTAPCGREFHWVETRPQVCRDAVAESSQNRGFLPQNGWVSVPPMWEADSLLRSGGKIQPKLRLSAAEWLG